MKREVDHLAAFMHMAVAHARQIGFNRSILFRAQAPRNRPSISTTTTWPIASNFLRAYDLADHVKMNIETNHATLAGHSMQHELEYAGSQGFLGSIDANTGDLLLGWGHRSVFRPTSI